MKMLTMSMMAAAFAIAPVLAQTQTTKPATTTQTAAATMNADQEFAKAAAGSGMAEVELAKLAQQKSTNAEVKALADRLVTDHMKANDELKSLAAAKGIMLPAMMDAKHKATHDSLAKLSGAAFDHAFMPEIVTAHKASVDRFRTESQTGKDPELKAFAAKTLPTIEAHLAQAEKIHSAVGTTGNK